MPMPGTQDDTEDKPQMSIGSIFPAQPTWETHIDAPYSSTRTTTGGGETTTPGPEFLESLNRIDATTGKRFDAENTLTGVKGKSRRLNRKARTET
jgi:hypothetical protein